MAKKALTDRFVETVKPPQEGRAVYADAKAPGLELRVTANGVKSWSIRYRPRGMKDKKGQPLRLRASFGAYPVVTLADARNRALDIAAAAARGMDLPAEEKKASDVARETAAKPRTVGDLLTVYVEEYCKLRQRQWKPVQAMFDRHVRPALGRKPLAELRKGDVSEFLQRLEAKGLRAQVNRIRTQLVAALNMAVERDWIEYNPAAAVRRKVPEQPRSRVLSDAELRAIWRAADALPDPSRAYVQLLILTGARRDEIRCMEWVELNEKDGDGSLWTLPARRNKGKRDHELPLPDAVREILGRLPRSGPYAISMDGKKPYGGAPYLKMMLDRDSKVTGWRYHDLRRTMRSGLAALGIPEAVAERTLNHAQAKLTRVYDVHSYRAEKLEALEKWAARVALIVSEGRDAPNIVEFRPAK